MPRIKDERIARGRANRNATIRAHFEKKFNDGYRYELIIEELILKYGLSESTIEQIIKQNGNYKD